MHNKAEFQQIALHQLTRGRYQPRRDFEPNALQELADSISEQGIIEPIIVRPIQTDRFEIIAGERRWRAAHLAGLHSVPCLVRYYSDEEAAAVTLIENIQREQLNPIEEAMAYKQLMDEFNYTHEGIAIAVGKSRTKITNNLRLLKLDTRVQKLLMEKKLSEGHGKMLAGLSAILQYELARKSVALNWSVRRIEQELKKIQADSTPSHLEKNHDVRHLENALGDHVGCKVNIDFDNGRGQLKIDFQNLEILQGILEKMGFVED